MKQHSSRNNITGGLHVREKSVKKKEKEEPKVDVPMDEKKSRRGTGYRKWNKGFPQRDETLDHANLQRNTYVGLPPDFGVTYGEGRCEACDFSYKTHYLVKPFCPQCGAEARYTKSEISSEEIVRAIDSVELKVCPTCGTSQYTKTNCVLCGSSIEGETTVKTKKKSVKKATAIDIDERSLEAEDDDVTIEIEDEGDDAEGSDVTALDEEINDGKKGDIADVDPIDEQLNEETDGDEGEEALNVKAEDEDDEDDEDEGDEADAGDEDVDLEIEEDEADAEDDLEDVDLEDDTDAEDVDLEDIDLEDDMEADDDEDVDLEIEDEAEGDDYAGEIYDDEAESMEDTDEDEEITDDTEAADEDVDIDIEDDEDSEGCDTKSGDEDEDEDEDEGEETDSDASMEHVMPLSEDMLDEPVTRMKLMLLCTTMIQKILTGTSLSKGCR